MMSGFGTIAMYLAMSVIGVGAMFLMSRALGPFRPTPTKATTYECGVPLLAAGHNRYSIKYYLVAVLFLIFDIETVLIYPLGVRYSSMAHNSWALFFEIFIFVAILLAGLVYAIKRGAIDWD